MSDQHSVPPPVPSSRPQVPNSRPKRRTTAPSLPSAIPNVNLASAPPVPLFARNTTSDIKIESSTTPISKIISNTSSISGYEKPEIPKEFKKSTSPVPNYNKPQIPQFKKNPVDIERQNDLQEIETPIQNETIEDQYEASIDNNNNFSVEQTPIRNNVIVEDQIETPNVSHNITQTPIESHVVEIPIAAQTDETPIASHINETPVSTHSIDPQTEASTVPKLNETPAVYKDSPIDEGEISDDPVVIRDDDNAEDDQNSIHSGEVSNEDQPIDKPLTEPANLPKHINISNPGNAQQRLIAESLKNMSNFKANLKLNSPFGAKDNDNDETKDSKSDNNNEDDDHSFVVKLNKTTIPEQTHKQPPVEEEPSFMVKLKKTSISEETQRKPIQTEEEPSFMVKLNKTNNQEPVHPIVHEPEEPSLMVKLNKTNVPEHVQKTAPVEEEPSFMVKLNKTSIPDPVHPVVHETEEPSLMVKLNKTTNPAPVHHVVHDTEEPPLMINQNKTDTPDPVHTVAHEPEESSLMVELNKTNNPDPVHPIVHEPEEPSLMVKLNKTNNPDPVRTIVHEPEEPSLMVKLNKTSGPVHHEKPKPVEEEPSFMVKLNKTNNPDPVHPVVHEPEEPSLMVKLNKTNIQNTAHQISHEGEAPFQVEKSEEATLPQSSLKETHPMEESVAKVESKDPLPGHSVQSEQQLKESFTIERQSNDSIPVNEITKENETTDPIFGTPRSTHYSDAHASDYGATPESNDDEFHDALHGDEVEPSLQMTNTSTFISENTKTDEFPGQLNRYVQSSEHHIEESIPTEIIHTETIHSDNYVESEKPFEHSHIEQVVHPDTHKTSDQSDDLEKKLNEDPDDRKATLKRIKEAIKAAKASGGANSDQIKNISALKHIKEGISHIRENDDAEQDISAPLKATDESTGELHEPTETLTSAEKFQDSVHLSHSNDSDETIKPIKQTTVASDGESTDESPLSKSTKPSETINETSDHHKELEREYETEKEPVHQLPQPRDEHMEKHVDTSFDSKESEQVEELKENTVQNTEAHVSLPEKTEDVMKLTEVSTEDAHTKKKAAPPPKPKKLGSKIAAFQEMLKRRQTEDLTAQTNNQNETATDSDEVSPDTAHKLVNIPSKLSGSKAKFANNLNGIFALPGMAPGGGSIPPALARKDSSMSASSTENLNAIPDSAEVNSQDTEGDHQQVREVEPTASRSRKGKGPRGRKLPTNVASIEKIKAEPTNDIEVFSNWKITWTPKISAMDSNIVKAGAQGSHDESFVTSVETPHFVNETASVGPTIEHHQPTEHISENVELNTNPINFGEPNVASEVSELKREDEPIVEEFKPQAELSSHPVEESSYAAATNNEISSEGLGRSSLNEGNHFVSDESTTIGLTHDNVDVNDQLPVESAVQPNTSAIQSAISDNILKHAPREVSGHHITNEAISNAVEGALHLPYLANTDSNISTQSHSTSPLVAEIDKTKIFKEELAKKLSSGTPLSQTIPVGLSGNGNLTNTENMQPPQEASLSRLDPGRQSPLSMGNSQTNISTYDAIETRDQDGVTEALEDNLERTAEEAMEKELMNEDIDLEDLIDAATQRLSDL